MLSKRTLVTCALPYANGPIHLGHMVEHIQTDIWVRFLRSCGEDVLFLCADDTHGTPVELNAAKQGLTPEEFVARFHVEHQKDFADFDVKFDSFHSTNSPENKHYAELIYGRLKERTLGIRFSPFMSHARSKKTLRESRPRGARSTLRCRRRMAYLIAAASSSRFATCRRLARALLRQLHTRPREGAEAFVCGLGAGSSCRSSTSTGAAAL